MDVSLFFGKACDVYPNNQNLAHGSRYPRRFTDHEMSEITHLLDKYRRLGKVDGWHLSCSQETSLFFVSNGNARDNCVLNIRKFKGKDEFFAYGMSSGFNNAHHTTPNFKSVMQTVEFTLEDAPLIAQPKLTLFTPQA